MPEEYSKEELWKLYEKLPDNLKDAIFSAETANSINNICQRNSLEEGKVTEIARYTGYVLMGLLSPDEFEKTLKEEVKLKNDSAKKVNQEINRFIFFPLRTTLEQLYKIEIMPVAKPTEETAKEKPRRDTYREPVE